MGKVKIGCGAMVVLFAAVMALSRPGKQAEQPAPSAVVTMKQDSVVLPTVTAIPPTSTSVPPTATTFAPTATPEPSLAYKLAVIQTGGYVAPTDPLVSRFQHALDTLAPKCQEPPDALAGFSLTTRKLLAQRGVDESPLSILTHVADSIPSGAPVMQCNEVFAAYATLRIGGH